MRLLSLLTFCLVAYGLAIPSPAEISVRDPGTTITVGDDSFSSAGIFSRDQSEAWAQAEKVVGHPLEHNKYYYFMSCNRAYRNDRLTTQPYLRYVIDRTDCVHVGLVIGKTSRLFKRFEAEYLHVRVDLDNRPDEWYQSRSNWDGPIGEQRITYGGESKSVKIKKLWEAGKQWVEQAGNRMDADWNCLRYYDRLVSLI
ncbi:hypothetical protein BDP81DRAFT_398039 [Colletotrichum phormii]|uniref:Uncharacterized protein n=1 Tax=Colletotrichum phormii TaxID=359342 RepID=A0AAI9ZHS5_9PEZI|nr:uncharacterized protein BDP81DRAFT_398039 [Colletotrichum phormii]KAK1624822.1 hypothetical protein BDP81DRAFT_398039 [Colletotrichum phormii]